MRKRKIAPRLNKKQHCEALGVFDGYFRYIWGIDRGFLVSFTDSFLEMENILVFLRTFITAVGATGSTYGCCAFTKISFKSLNSKAQRR